MTGFELRISGVGSGRSTSQYVGNHTDLVKIDRWSIQGLVVHMPDNNVRKLAILDPVLRFELTTSLSVFSNVYLVSTFQPLIWQFIDFRVELKEPNDTQGIVAL